MKKLTILSTLLFLTLLSQLEAQVGINNPSPNASSVLDIISSSKGVLIPRVALTATTDLTTVAAPVTSLLIYNTATAGTGTTAVVPGYYYWDGSISTWINIAAYVLRQNINTNGKFISGDGTNTGISLSDNGTLVSKGIYGSGTTITEAGGGTKLIWYPKKAAFRAGNVDAAQWDDANIGFYSTATGFDTKASGYYSVAMGIGNLATGNYSTALGRDNLASGDYSLCIGSNNVASGMNSTCLGHSVTSSGNGSFSIGDNFTGTINNYLDNVMMMRFDASYQFYTADVGTAGVYLYHNANSWLSLCDKTHKENFEPLNGETVLDKLSAISFTSWNYKKQDPKQYRHYGIMAQDFNAAFGHDKYGTIGNDTTVNPIDMIGIDMVAIQALEKRTRDLKNENELLKQSIVRMQAEFIEQQKLLATRLKQLENRELK